jgi:hypothetical protein
METQAQTLPQTGSQRPALVALLVDLLVTVLLQPAAVLTVVWHLRPWTLVLPIAVAAIPLAVALRALRRSPRAATWLAVAWSVVLALAAGAWVLLMNVDVMSW